MFTRYLQTSAHSHNQPKIQTNSHFSKLPKHAASELGRIRIEIFNHPGTGQLPGKKSSSPLNFQSAHAANLAFRVLYSPAARQAPFASSRASLTVNANLRGGGRGGGTEAYRTSPGRVVVFFFYGRVVARPQHTAFLPLARDF